MGKNIEKILYSEMEFLDEDMLQIEYSELILDFGYYEGIGAYKIYIIKDNNWEKPVSEITFNNIDDVGYLLELYKKKCMDGRYMTGPYTWTECKA